MTHRFRHPVAVAVLMALGSCSSPNKPTPPTPDPPSVTCPAPVSLVSPDGARVPYLFALPTAVNGQPPVSVSCTGVQAAGYPLGSTMVTCTATDALSRQASCSFSITVTATPKISKTKFLAFGDSITYGRCGPAPNECPAYAVRLEELLRTRYTAQSFSVLNVGIPGETASHAASSSLPAGEDRLPTALDTYTPEVLLLMEGTNDLNAGEAFATRALDALEDMIDLARSRGITVFIATIAPIAPGGASNSTIPLVAPFNAAIRDIASQRGVPLVDIYAALASDIPRFYSGNDLHPTAEGHRVMGETFYAAIRAALDITPGGSSAFSAAPGRFNILESPNRLRPVRRQPIK